jgi:hypothetical protein
LQINEAINTQKERKAQKDGIKMKNAHEGRNKTKTKRRKGGRKQKTTRI